MTLLSIDEIAVLLGDAKAEGWTRAADEKPPVGERVRVMHCLSRGYDCDGEIDHAGQWQCSNGFILPNMMLSFSPTHWRPMEQHDEAGIEEAA